MKKIETVNENEVQTLLPEFDPVALAENMRKVQRAANALLKGPIKKEAMFLLIASKLSDRRQGTRVVEDVFRAAAKLGEYLQ